MSMDTAIRNKNHFYYFSRNGAKPLRKTKITLRPLRRCEKNVFTYAFKLTMHRFITTFNLN
jgi:hypothetical protein